VICGKQDFGGWLSIPIPTTGISRLTLNTQLSTGLSHRLRCYAHRAPPLVELIPGGHPGEAPPPTPRGGARCGPGGRSPTAEGPETSHGRSVEDEMAA